MKKGFTETAALMWVLLLGGPAGAQEIGVSSHAYSFEIRELSWGQQQLNTNRPRGGFFELGIYKLEKQWLEFGGGIGAGLFNTPINDEEFADGVVVPILLKGRIETPRKWVQAFAEEDVGYFIVTNVETQPSQTAKPASNAGEYTLVGLKFNWRRTSVQFSWGYLGFQSLSSADLFSIGFGYSL